MQRNEFGEYDPTNQGRNTGTYFGFIMMGIGVLSLVIVYTIIPLVGSQLQTAVDNGNFIPASGAGSQWNSSVNTAIPTARGLWGTLGGIMKIAGLILVIGGMYQTIFPRKREPARFYQ